MSGAPVVDQATQEDARSVRHLKLGSIVRVRSRKWLVTEIIKPPAKKQDSLVRLACLEDDAQGETLDVLWERELDAAVGDDITAYAELEKGFDTPRLFSAWLHTLYWNRVTAADPNIFQAPDRAGIEVKTYQLEPLRKALRLPRVNLFIADDVGLGKTIEAGLIARELILRQRARRIVIMAPPSVVVQWQEEMEQRFGLTFRIYDRDFVLKTRRERGYAVNPWNTHGRFIVSHALIRNESYAASLRDWLGEFNPASLLILDEAHNAAPASGSKYAVDSNFTKIIRGLAHRFEHKLFLSATPHNGHSNSFTALLELLDPQRFCRGIEYDDIKTRLKPIMVRRLKKDLRQLTDGFPDRSLIPFIVDGLPEDTPELLLSQMLQTYRESREAALKKVKGGKKHATLLVINHLQKRLLSSFPAFAHTLAVHMETMEKNEARAPQTKLPGETQLNLLQEGVGQDDELAEYGDSEVRAQEDLAVQKATAACADTLSSNEWDLLNGMLSLARKHEEDPDTRVNKLLDWIKTNQCPDLGQTGAKWLPRRLIIFTEYTTTKDYLYNCLSRASGESHLGNTRIRTFQGGLGDDKREELKASFNAHPDEDPLRILIATDAAREGVNLQNHCYDLLHFDVPWNPARMEQRNGRIDRKLQKSPRVYCRYFVLPQRAEDKVLDTLMTKTATILDELGSMSPVVHRNMKKLLKAGIDHKKAQDMQIDLEKADRDKQNGTIARELDFTRETLALEKEIKELAELLQTSREWLHLDTDHFREALSTALGQLGAEPLKQQIGEDGKPCWSFPALEQLLKAGPGWAVTLDTLRTPRPRDTKLWEWRKTAPIRPVVFADTGNMDRKQVHLHLEHRVVQRLLGGFKTRGFHQGTISRACICKTDRFTKAHVVLIGRLSLYGPNAGRLHDDLVTVVAEWRPPGSEAPQLLPEEDTDKVWQAVLQSLAETNQEPVTAEQENRFKATFQRDVASLEPELKRRIEALETRTRTKLKSRGDGEARQMRSILQKQKQLLQAKINPETPIQMDLPGQEEENQYKREQKHWEARLAEIDGEMEEEPKRVRRTYSIQASRFEPTGIVWLWPVTA